MEDASFSRWFRREPRNDVVRGPIEVEKVAEWNKRWPRSERERTRDLGAVEEGGAAAVERGYGEKP